MQNTGILRTNFEIDLLGFGSILRFPRARHQPLPSLCSVQGLPLALFPQESSEAACAGWRLYFFFWIESRIWLWENARLLWEKQQVKIPQQALFACEEAEALPMESEYFPTASYLHL